MTPLPREILERVERVCEYHKSSKLDEATLGALASRAVHLHPYRYYDALPITRPPTTLLDLPIETLSLMEFGRDALPESQQNPSQDLKTLTTWLFMSYGQMRKREVNGHSFPVRSCQSAGLLYPCQLYVAAFGIEGLEPGLYHFSARDFALRKLRDGLDALFQIKRGRPDLEFVKTSPAMLLVSTAYWRSSSMHHRRAYRCALSDAGHLVDNLTTVASALGIQTVARLRCNEASMRELLGLGPEILYGIEESVQAMLVWGAQAQKPLVAPAGHRPQFPLPAIERPAPPADCISYASIIGTHLDCVSPGVVTRDVRPPLTEFSPLPQQFPVQEFPPADDVEHGELLRKVLAAGAFDKEIGRRTISRQTFLRINRLAFRGGSFFPVIPDGAHVGLVRPFWIIHDVIGIDSGIWYYHPPTDAWSMLSRGSYRMECAYMAGDEASCGNAAAVCCVVANLHALMHQGGPDLYRLANLEAGIVSERLCRAASAYTLGGRSFATFYDEEIRKFCGLEKTGWEVLELTAIGVPHSDEVQTVFVDDDEDDPWRD